MCVLVLRHEIKLGELKCSPTTAIHGSMAVCVGVYVCAGAEA